MGSRRGEDALRHLGEFQRVLTAKDVETWTPQDLRKAQAWALRAQRIAALSSSDPLTAARIDRQLQTPPGILNLDVVKTKAPQMLRRALLGNPSLSPPLLASLLSENSNASPHTELTGLIRTQMLRKIACNIDTLSANINKLDESSNHQICMPLAASILQGHLVDRLRGVLECIITKESRIDSRNSHLEKVHSVLEDPSSEGEEVVYDSLEHLCKTPKDIEDLIVPIILSSSSSRSTLTFSQPFLHDTRLQDTEKDFLDQYNFLNVVCIHITSWLLVRRSTDTFSLHPDVIIQLADKSLRIKEAYKKFLVDMSSSCKDRSLRLEAFQSAFPKHEMNNVDNVDLEED